MRIRSQASTREWISRPTTEPRIRASVIGERACKRNWTETQWIPASGATRQGWSRRIGVCDDTMKPCSSSSGCETRPARGEPARPVASLAPETVTDWAKRRHASEWAVSGRAPKLNAFRVLRVSEDLKATAGAPVAGRGARRTRRGRRARHARRGWPRHLGGPCLSSGQSRRVGSRGRKVSGVASGWRGHRRDGKERVSAPR